MWAVRIMNISHRNCDQPCNDISLYTLSHQEVGYKDSPKCYTPSSFLADPVCEVESPRKRPRRQLTADQFGR